MIALESNGLSLGGEQSGHIIHRDLATTGDGLLAAVQLFGVLSRAASSLGDVSARAMTSFPQVLINVSVSGSASELVARCSGVIASVEADLGGEGRVLVRPSGTEPLVRVMVEAATHAAARAGAERIAAAIADSPAAAEE
jgi:phosphoglucosamine mutase